jgi:hypothetical protein
MITVKTVIWCFKMRLKITIFIMIKKKLKIWKISYQMNLNLLIFQITILFCRFNLIWKIFKKLKKKMILLWGAIKAIIRKIKNMTCHCSTLPEPKIFRKTMKFNKNIKIQIETVNERLYINNSLANILLAKITVVGIIKMGY